MHELATASSLEAQTLAFTRPGGMALDGEGWLCVLPSSTQVASISCKRYGSAVYPA